MKHKERFDAINTTFQDTSYGINISSNVETNDTYDSNILSHDMISTLSERFAWEKHSSGVAMKIMNKIGYKGKILGKTENGIMETITIKPRGFSVNNTAKKRKKIYIISDSMLNQMDKKGSAKSLM